MSGHSCNPCPDCQGAGWRWTDDYTGQPVAHDERPRKRVAQGTARARSHTVTVVGLDDHAGRWETAQERADKTGSYRALREAMGRLAAQDPRAHRLVVVVHVRGSQRELTQRERRRLERGMGALSAMMPREVKLPQWLAERLAGEQRRRDALSLRDRGASLREVTRQTGARARHRRAIREAESA